MQIHVVQPGQSLFGIAQAYSTTVNNLVEANEIPNPNRLVVGQTLVIPIIGSFYWVQPGDSLWSIGLKFGISYQELAEINRISLIQPLQIGTRLYIPPTQKTSREFNAYIEPRTTVTPALENSAREAAPYLTYLAPFSYEVLRDGSLREPPLNQFPQIATANRNLLMMVITNKENDQFSDELGKIILNDEQVQENLFNNIITTAKKQGFRDIHFDFEYLRPEDRQAYNNFLRKAKARFSKEGWLVSTALAPKTSADQKGKWYEAHDYRAHGEIVDFVVIMTYEWGYSGGPPMAVSPIGPVREVLEYAVTEIPPQKIFMGQNLYGYDWILPFKKGDVASAVSPQQAIKLAAQKNVPIQYDVRSQAPFFDYIDENGRNHRVWFEDARSIQAKFDLIKELNLRGMSYWKLGLSFPQNWLLIQENFTVEKR
ncbi:glycoside hydrolase family 18 protein [Fervidibacillus halotolerans]|uniref:Glycoside hydrolase family 18 protein n=1 Tax=Fervidibacillus halotolerans TaxID=2980027 RepID=A0A9E8M0E7_9BACI|nr:glycoside hydrolase family 18 protein [Fervidibacillus halotolerans]WAA12311.1 glycoside hydrolase family 18 protein [Fervidibacillus halotolerans]